MVAAPTGIDKAKGGSNSNDEKKVVAGGIAVATVVVLFIAWAVIFLHRIQNGSQELQLGGVVDKFNITSVKDAQQKLQDSYNNPNQDLQDLRNQTEGDQQQSQQQFMQPVDSGVSQFSDPNATQ
jgi:hypothetical protein